MRRYLALLMSLVLAFGFTACGGKEAIVPEEFVRDENGDILIDFTSEIDFESALNAGDDVTGKIVSFVAKEIHPDSALGYNIYSGEHLNFVSDGEVNVHEGDTVLAFVKTTKKVMGSWKIEYEIVDDSEGPQIKYDKAIQYLLKGDYSQADRILSEIDINDAKSLEAYCEALIKLDNGSVNDAKSFKTTLDGVGDISNEDVKALLETDKAEVEKAVSAQSNLDAIDINDPTTYPIETLNTINTEIGAIGDRYLILINKDIWEKAMSVRKALDEETDVGQLIVSIDKLDKDSIKWTKLEKKVKKLNKKYESLPQDQKNLIINRDKLKEIEEYVKLKREEKEEKERQKEEEAKRKEEERARQEAYENEIVYVTRTGNKYHDEGCQFVNSNARTMTRKQAERQGLEPCEVCNP